MSVGTRPAPMNVAFERPSLWQRIVPVFTGFDGPLSLAILLLAAAGMVTMYSAGFDSGTRFVDHGRNMLIAFGILFLVAQIPPQRLMSLAVPLYVIGVILLVAVEFAGVTKKGATRWLNVGVVIQPSEMLKIAVPLMLAWWFQRREGQLRALDFAVAGLLSLHPELAARSGSGLHFSGSQRATWYQRRVAASPRASAQTLPGLAPTNVPSAAASATSSAGGWTRSATWLPSVPEDTQSPAGLPSSAATSSCRRLTDGSSPYQSSPTSALAMACRMPAVGRVTVSERRSTVPLLVSLLMACL